MRFSDWDPVYREILKDMGYSRSSDEASARMLKAMTQNSDLISEDLLSPIITKETVVVGGNVSPDDIEKIGKLRSERIKRTIISAGSATETLVRNEILPDIVVTDLDGDIISQKRASSLGSVTIVHAHGDNTDLIMKHVKDIKGPMIITTQSVPDQVLCNFGGFTDGDRSVCLARHFGAKRIILVGFDLDSPSCKPDTDIEIKKRKLRWAKKIIYDMNTDDVIIASL